MKIHNDNQQTSRLYDDELMSEYYDPPGIEFSDEGIARVREAVGTALAESDAYPTISAVEEASQDDEDEGDDEDDDTGDEASDATE